MPFSNLGSSRFEATTSRIEGNPEVVRELAPVGWGGTERSGNGFFDPDTFALKIERDSVGTEGAPSEDGLAAGVAGVVLDVIDANMTEVNFAQASDLVEFDSADPELFLGWV